MNTYANKSDQKFMRDRSTRGYTIVEMIISIGLFSLAFGAISTIFIGFTNTQTKASTSQKLLNEANYILTSLASDIRSSSIDYTSTGCGVSAGSSNILCLKSFDGKYIRYEYANDTVQSAGTVLKICKSYNDSLCALSVFNTSNPALSLWAIKKSAFMTVSGLNFYIYPAANPNTSNSGNTGPAVQPSVTILLKASAGTAKSAQSYDLQTTVTSRQYTY